jgi:hypothetical protein
MPLKSCARVAVAGVGLIGALAILEATPASAFCRAPVEAYAEGYIPTAFTQIVSLESPNVIQGLHRD